MDQVSSLLSHQDGVIARRQLVAAGWADHDIARQLRRRRWAPVFEGVYADHTGVLTWSQRAWAAVLFSWPAALGDESSLRAFEGTEMGPAGVPIRLVVARRRHLVEPEGVRIRRCAAFDQVVQWNLAPPRVRYEQAVLDVASRAVSELEAVAVLARAVQSRRTTARRMLSALESGGRRRRRTWIEAVLHDIADGTCSVLEHGYLTRVERPHGLPRAERQAVGRGRTGRVYRDTTYTFALVVELDGRVPHESPEGRDSDFDRDLVTQVAGQLTTRLSWGQVFDRACWTAGQVGQLLQQRGWTGAPTPCGPSCCLGG